VYTAPSPGYSRADRGRLEDFAPASRQAQPHKQVERKGRAAVNRTMTGSDPACSDTLSPAHPQNLLAGSAGLCAAVKRRRGDSQGETPAAQGDAAPPWDQIPDNQELEC